MPVVKTDFTKLFRSARGGTKKGQINTKLNHNQALKEIRKLDPDFLKRTVRTYNKKLSKGQEKLVRSKLKEVISEMRVNNQSDIYRPTKRKGESKRAYNKRVQELKEKYNQGDNNAKGIYMQTLSKGAKTKYRLNRDGSITQSTKDGALETKSLFIPPSQIPPDNDSLFEDIATALDSWEEVGFKDFKSVQITTSIEGKRGKEKSAEALTNFMKRDENGEATGELLNDVNFIIQRFATQIYSTLLSKGGSGGLENYGGIVIEGN